MSLHATKTYLKGQGHLKVKVTQYQGQMERKSIFVYLQMFLLSICYADDTPLTD